MKPRLCKDCEPVARPRPAPHPGPRCATHHRAHRQHIQLLAHGNKIRNTYGITAQQYAALYTAQGGRCPICGIATGKARRLAVDHNHHTGEIRGLLCSPCNITIGRLGTPGLVRAINYLNNPPARKVLS